jgi:hypothetical protein
MEAGPIAIGKRGEFFWDDYLIDTARTTARLALHSPQPQEVVLVHDAPWEGDGCDFHCILADDGLYRLYYLGWETMDPDVTHHVPNPIVVCYAESTDGKTWVKPNLGICEFQGTRDNNIILNEKTAKFDNFSVFKDANPACPPTERYKGVGIDVNDHYLWCFTSADGIHFHKAWQMTNQGRFDTLNIAFWDHHAGRYICYIRDFHDMPPGGTLNDAVRDIRWMVSDDFRSWSTPVRLDFGDAGDYPLYTNVVQPYYRGDHLFVGFPSRYAERKEWTPNYDQLPGVERRRKRMKVCPRYGLAVTDCLFMCSRDGRRWQRWDEAFLRPGPERDYNWVYGDCYPAVGMIETPSHLSGAPPELSMYAFDNHWGAIPTELRRYTIRIDGFVSYRATFKPQRVVTKPFLFEGRDLLLNFATSAAGSVRITLRSGSDSLTSCELFGDSLARRVFPGTDEVARLAGKPVTMEIEMSDADIYSFIFE